MCPPPQKKKKKYIKFNKNCFGGSLFIKSRQIHMAGQTWQLQLSAGNVQEQKCTKVHFSVGPVQISQ